MGNTHADVTDIRAATNSSAAAKVGDGETPPEAAEEDVNQDYWVAMDDVRSGDGAAGSSAAAA